MANVPPEIMNHLRRSQLHKDRAIGGLSVPEQRRGDHDKDVSASSKEEKTPPSRSKGLLSRLALKLAGPELSGD